MGEGLHNSYEARMVILTTFGPAIAAAVLNDALLGHVRCSTYRWVR